MLLRSFEEIPIKRKLALIIVLTSLTAVLIAAFGYTILELQSFRRSLVNDLSTLAQVIGANSTAALSFDDLEATTEYLNALKFKPSVRAACFYNRRGELFGSYVRQGEKMAFPPKAGPAQYQFDRSSLTLTQDISVEGKKIGAIFIQSDLSELYARILRY